MDIIFTSNRELSEVQKSWQRISDRQITMDDVHKANKDYVKWAVHSDMDINFIDIQENKKGILLKMIEIIETHGFQNKIDIDIILQHIEKIKPPATGFGKESGLFFSHIAT